MFETFQEWLVSLRKAKGLSGNQLALMADVNQSHLSQVERGVRRMTDEMAVKLAPHLGSSVDEIKAMRDADEQFKETPEYQAKMFELWQARMARRDLILNVLNASERQEHKHPLTPEEEDLVNEARRLEEEGPDDIVVWTTDLNDPSFFDYPPDDPDRRAVFEYLEGLLDAARRYMDRRKRRA